VAEQLALDLVGDHPRASGLPEMGDAERVRAELEVLGLDISHHVVDFYAPMLDDLAVTRSRDLLSRRSRSEVLVAGVKVAIQTPPVRSGRRVIFLTLDDGTGPVDAAAFDDAQGPYAATLFGSWLLLVRGVLRRTGPRGVSVRATGCWDLGAVHAAWRSGGAAEVHDLIAVVPGGGSAAPPQRRVLVHASGFRQSPYADIRPASSVDAPSGPPGKLWHSSPGSSGW
jgi:error-prone DNA polymerase